MTKNAWLIPSLVTSCILSILCACFVGSTPLSFSRIAMAFTGTGIAGDQVVLWSIRLPRAIAAFLAGAALGLSGAALQGLFKNPLAGPGVLGVSASASLMAAFALYSGLVGLTPWLLPFASIFGALLATSLLALAAFHTQSIVTLLLIGVGLSSIAGAAMSLLVSLAPNPFSLSDMINWLLGSVAHRSFSDIAILCPFLVVGAATLLHSARGLSALALGEEVASSIGLNVYRQRILIVIGTGLVTGASVALAGSIGFVGIVVPHIIRPLVAHDPARSLIPSALLSGVLLVLADILVRTLPSGTELKLGVVTALIGAPAFIWIVMQRRI